MINFYFELSSVGDWISIFLTLLGLIIAVLALNQWQKQKQWEILAEAIAYAKPAADAVKFFIVVDLKTTIGKAKFSDIYDLANTKAGKYHNLPNHIRLINEKLKFIFKGKENVVTIYYMTIIKRLNELERLKHERIISQNLKELTNFLFLLDNTTAEILKEHSQKDIPEFKDLSEEHEEEIDRLLKEVREFKMNKWWYLF